MSMEFEKSKKKHKLPWYDIFIIVFCSLFIIAGVIKVIVDAKTEKSKEQIEDIMPTGKQPGFTDKTSYVGATSVSYKGLSIKIPKGWTAEADDEGLIHWITIVPLDDDDWSSCSICWGLIEDSPSPYEWIEICCDSEADDSPDFSSGEIVESSFCGTNAYEVNYIDIVRLYGVTLFGKITSFMKGGNVYVITIESDLKSNLSKKFDFIEDAFRIL